MSYYQVHKIQPITKRHVLLLDFAIITQKPTKICQVSCKNQSHISARVSDDISRPIRLWHVSSIRLRHVSLTHPQTPINRSIPKAFREDKEDLEVQKLCKNQASKLSRTSILKLKNIQSKIIQIIFLDLKGHWNQAQKPPKTSTNYKLVKLCGFKPPKPRRTSITNLQIRRTFEAESSKLPA